MNYYIDTEFLEGTQKYGQPWFNFWLGPKPKTKPTIDLISIGIVAEDGREYYAISKDFNLREAWNRWQIKEVKCSPGKWDNNEDALIRKDSNTLYKKDYWIRENVLRSIWNELCTFHINNANHKHFGQPITDTRILKFNYKNFKWLINKYGKSNQQIAEEVKEFTLEVPRIQKHGNPKFYAYFADYDWVAFCWLFGKMIDLPKGFPMYCVDLKQFLDERLKAYTSIELSKATCPSCKHNVYEAMDYKNPLITMQGCIKDHPNYPKLTDEHNALADAKWNKELHEFIQSL